MVEDSLARRPHAELNPPNATGSYTCSNAETREFDPAELLGQKGAREAHSIGSDWSRATDLKREPCRLIGRGSSKHCWLINMEDVT